MYMDQFNKVKKQLSRDLDRERYIHTLGVAETAQCLAMRYETDLDRAYLAGLLHDCAKCIPAKDRLRLCGRWNIPVKAVEEKNTGLLHAKMGAYLAKDKYGVTDPEILSAIACHTVGKPAMTLLEKILFVADYIEANRDKAENLKQIRKTAFLDIDSAVLLILKGTIEYLKSGKSKDIDPDTETVYQYYQKLLEGEES